MPAPPAALFRSIVRWARGGRSARPVASDEPRICRQARAVRE
ncbi:conserved hypothetical protein [Burkholderia pseudomallei MSHR346]|uniref:Uncharacterized protein n=1 Tax=Burkholderia pseudomallei (strain 1106a) TaxID=357348 RepID=A3NV98_BURP0|nr:hypothetical protein BURPS1106A_2004 [Burkholderia pseudomallei 1106a]ACQ98551.1 conserved hypothetical protein [Burkholderia pseudomallei MSHR346]EDU07363.1 hypothetical protein BURPS1655_A1796 [Burkholderia pseudomallei 1655]